MGVVKVEQVVGIPVAEDKFVDVPVIKYNKVPQLQKVTKRVEVPTVSYEDKVVDLPVVKPDSWVRSVDAQIREVAVPQVMYKNKVVDVPEVRVVEVPKIVPLPVPQVHRVDEFQSLPEETLEVGEIDFNDTQKLFSPRQEEESEMPSPLSFRRSRSTGRVLTPPRSMAVRIGGGYHVLDDNATS